MSGKTLEKSTLIEKVCEKCPATCWGKKSTCNVHNLHVGRIDACPEWDKFTVSQQGLQDHDGQLAFTDMEPAMEWVQKAEEAITEYRFMLTRASWIRRELDRAISDSGAPGSSLVAQYGEEAGMPKAQGKKLTSLTIPEELYERKLKRLRELQAKIDAAVKTITEPQEKAALECLLDGEKIKTVAVMVGVSRQWLYEIKRSIVIKLAWALFGNEEGQHA